MTPSQASPSANKDVQARFIHEVQEQAKIDAVDELMAADVVDHTPPPGFGSNRDSIKAHLAAIRAAFPDHDAKIVHMIAEDDLVATYKTFTGTHTGTFLGVAPTGKRVTIRVMDFVRIRDGQVVDHWNVVDRLEILTQLEAAPNT